MTERVTVWRCIGCGRVEGPQQCVGVCEDRRDEMIYAADHDRELARIRNRMENLTAVLRQVAFTTPRKGECERTWAALQERARGVLEAMANEERAGPA